MIVTFRNDDVRSELDTSLVELTQLFIDRSLPITHAVEPANITPIVVDWLLAAKKKNERLIEIVQHGYNHAFNIQIKRGNRMIKGEFGGDMTYNQQYGLISKGKEKMDSYFKGNWFRGFVFPNGMKNKHSLIVLNDLGYKVVTGVHHYDLKHKLFYFLGRFFSYEELIGHKVSYNLNFRNGLDIFEIGTGISFIKRYHNENNAEFYSLDELKLQTISFKKSKVENLGVLFHHRFHNDSSKMDLVCEYLDWILTFKDITFSSLEDIFELYRK